MNGFHILECQDSTGQVKGWYCNIAEPVSSTDSEIKMRDLLLDIFVWPNGTYRILDAEELEENKQKLNAAKLLQIDNARQNIVRMVDARQSPFDLIGA